MKEMCIKDLISSIAVQCMHCDLFGFIPESKENFEKRFYNVLKELNLPSCEINYVKVNDKYINCILKYFDEEKNIYEKIKINIGEMVIF